MNQAGKREASDRPRKLQWVRLPRPGRSPQTLERFLAAAETLIHEKGFQATSAPEIARAAGCSVGLFYTRFRDKNDILRYLLEHYLGEIESLARRVLRARATEMKHPDPDTAARCGIRLVSGLLPQRALLGRLVPRQSELPWRLLAEEPLRTLYAYLGVRAIDVAPGEKGGYSQ